MVPQKIIDFSPSQDIQDFWHSNAVRKYKRAHSHPWCLYRKRQKRSCPWCLNVFGTPLLIKNWNLQLNRLSPRFDYSNIILFQWNNFSGYTGLTGFNFFLFKFNMELAQFKLLVYLKLWQCSLITMVCHLQWYRIKEYGWN